MVKMGSINYFLGNSLKCTKLSNLNLYKRPISTQPIVSNIIPTDCTYTFDKNEQFYFQNVKFQRIYEPSKINKLWQNALIDKYGRFHNYLRISLNENCNLRCQYCMPAEGVPLSPHNLMLTTSEIIRFAQIIAKAGVQKIRLTGGEPTIRKDFEDLVLGLSKVEGLKTFAMTTNGIILHRYIPVLKEAQMNAINISLDTLIPARYTLITRRNGFNKVWRAIEALTEDQFCQIKLNCVIIKGFNEDEIIEFVKLTENWAIEVRFIEYMPFTKNGWEDRKLYTKDEMLKSIYKEFPNLYKLNNINSETAVMFSIPNFKGSFGIISSMSDMFCSKCNRLRLTADGNLKNCLFGAKEFLVRNLLKQNYSDEEIINIISYAISEKAEKHGGADVLKENEDANRSMVRIGG